MQRWLALVLIGALALCMLCGCSSAELQTVTGSYALAAHDYAILGTEIMSRQTGGKPAYEQTLVIEEKDDVLSFRDNYYSGSCKVIDDMVVLMREEVIVENETIAKVFASTMEKQSREHYTVYGDALINMSSPLVVGQTHGSVPGTGEFSDFAFTEIDSTYTEDFHMTFRNDGTCTVGTSAGTVSGTYEVKDKLIVMTLTTLYYESDYAEPNTYTATVTAGVYVDDTGVYTSVYLKQ